MISRIASGYTPLPAPEGLKTVNVTDHTVSLAWFVHSLALVRAWLIFPLYLQDASQRSIFLQRVRRRHKEECQPDSLHCLHCGRVRLNFPLFLC